MLKVLLVDDEEEIREGMANKISWESLGFFKPMTAENGIDALELSEKIRPDIIVTDIQMPFMDGLDFIEKVSNELPETKFIVFSGYDDFEYAQRAISLKVDKYLLKPFSSEDLIEILKEVKKTIEEEQKSRLNLKHLQEQFEASIDLFRENFLMSCLNGTMDKEDMARYQKELDFPDLFDFRLILFEFHQEVTETINHPSLMKIAAKDLAKEEIEKVEKPILFFYGENLIWLSLHLKNDKQVDVANKICRGMTSLNFLTLAGVSKEHHHLIDLKEALNEAQSALDFSNHLNQQTSFAMVAEDIPHSGKTRELMVSEVEARKLNNILKYGDSAKTNSFIKDIFRQAQERKFNRFEYTAFLSEWVGILSRACSCNETLKAENLIIEITKEMENKADLPFEEGYLWFENCCQEARKILQADIQQSSKGQINEGLQYIEEHFADPNLTAESLSQYLHLNAAYFSVLFKKQVGKTFTNYLTEKRMEEAKQLLENTEDKTYLIAEKVGYLEPNYFSYVFKKETGQSPTKYRKSLTDKGAG